MYEKIHELQSFHYSLFSTDTLWIASQYHHSKYVILNYTRLLSDNIIGNLESPCHWFPTRKMNGLKIP